jgi:hypothetical protein
MGEPIWSQRFAWGIARSLGWSPPDAVPSSDHGEIWREVEELVGRITEDFRYLPFEQIGWAEDLAQFFRAREAREEQALPPGGWLLSKLREIREYVAFLRTRYGSAQPADESDEWTEEDLRDLSRATWQRLEEEDPWPEDDYSHEGQGNGQTG